MWSWKPRTPGETGDDLKFLDLVAFDFLYYWPPVPLVETVEFLISLAPVGIIDFEPKSDLVIRAYAMQPTVRVFLLRR